MPSLTNLIPFALAIRPGAQEPKTAPTSPSAPATGAQAPGSTLAPGTPGAPAAGPTATDPCGGSSMPLYLGLFLVLMYFMIMRPEQKRRKEQQNLLSSIKVGDRVVTIGGLHGKVAKLAEKTVTLQVDSVQMTYDRTSIARVERDDAPSTDARKA